MRRGAAPVIGLALSLLSGAAAAEQLTVAVSTDEIRIDSSFSGTTVTVFGVIERDAATISRGGDYEVAMVLRGPPENVVARRKDRILGIWANRASETFLAAPSFYALSTTRDLDGLAAEAVLKRLQIGFENIAFAYAQRAEVNDPAANEFRQAFLRLKQQARLYTDQPAGVSFIGDSVFRSTLAVPANVPDGRFVLTVFLFSGEVLLAQAEDTIEITKTGFEQFMFMASQDQALPYGLACVALALVIGWLGGVIFRRD